MAGAEYPWERALGAVPGGDGTVEFRVWAPHPERVDGRVRGADHALEPEGYGVHSARIERAAGDDYAFVLDGREPPDPPRPRSPRPPRRPGALPPRLPPPARGPARAVARRRPARVRMDRPGLGRA